MKVRRGHKQELCLWQCRNKEKSDGIKEVNGGRQMGGMTWNSTREEAGAQQAGETATVITREVVSTGADEQRAPFRHFLFLLLLFLWKITYRMCSVTLAFLLTDPLRDNQRDRRRDGTGCLRWRRKPHCHGLLLKQLKMFAHLCSVQKLVECCYGSTFYCINYAEPSS